ncbi:MAG: hypothetical protein WCW44_05525 [archaeon]|jgi:anaerobic ribonucleoside-triphosphate reductase
MELIEEKIQTIAKEILEAGASEWTITKIIKSLSELNTTSEKKLRERALEMLKELDTNAALVYERFSKMKVYTSKETIHGFNRGNIITSLLKETTLSRTVAEKITLEVENQIKDAKISFLTPSLIRELVNARLITYGFEEVRNSYSRVGEAVADVAKKLQEGPYAGETVREYNILIQLPKKARELHFDGTIFIEDMEGYSHRPFAYSFVAEKKNSLEETICSAIKMVSHNRKYFYLPPSIYGLTFACAPFVKNPAQIKKTAELIKSTMEILEEKPTLSLELFTPTKFEQLSSFKVNASKISEQLLEENVVVGIDSQYCLKLIETKGKQFMILNNAIEEYYPLSKNLFSPTIGIDLFVNLNLERIADGNDEKEFFEKLNYIAEEIKKIKQNKKELLLKKKYLTEFRLNELKTGIGITNLFKLAENFPNAKPIEFANKTYKELSKLFEEDLLFGCTDKARERFSNTSGKEIFAQETMQFDECLSSKKTCFTGKAGSIKELNELLEKKVKQIEFIGME